MLSLGKLREVTGGRLSGAPAETKITGISLDSRSLHRREAFLALKGDNFDGHDFLDQAIAAGARAIIAQSREAVARINQKKIPVIMVKDTCRALGDIGSYLRKASGLPVVAITGSNGKTTVKEMIACLLSIRYKVLKNTGTKNNHIGLPQTLLGLEAGHERAVLEIGTNHFGEVAYLAGICRPNVAVFTNIGPAHLESFKDLPGVLREKYSLIESLQSPRVVVFNADDRLLSAKFSRAGRKVFALSFGFGRGRDFSAGEAKLISGGWEFDINRRQKVRLSTCGRQNIYNALAAIAVARVFGIGYKDIRRALGEFQFPPGRMELKNIGGLHFIDDTYNANPLSFSEALGTLALMRCPGRKILVMGDMLELGDHAREFHRQIGLQAAGVCDSFIAAGDLSGISASAALNSGMNPKDIFTCSLAAQAREILINKLKPTKNDIILVKGSRGMKMEGAFPLTRKPADPQTR